MDESRHFFLQLFQSLSLANSLSLVQIGRIELRDSETRIKGNGDYMRFLFVAHHTLIPLSQPGEIGLE